MNCENGGRQPGEKNKFPHVSATFSSLTKSNPIILKHTKFFIHIWSEFCQVTILSLIEANLQQKITIMI